ncbi:hypothetical protein C8Q77DRAFT_1076079 [Trametes polyzona]|nr:hypothetical protein C8Q77DRAFT_1076079 [Trametes polyzona]
MPASSRGNVKTTVLLERCFSSREYTFGASAEIELTPTRGQIENKSAEYKGAIYRFPLQHPTLTFTILTTQRMLQCELRIPAVAEELMPWEFVWRDRYQYLQDNGYELRPRYHPNWSPSWIDTDFDPKYCEDSVPIREPSMIDARRTEDSRLVSIKVVETSNREVSMLTFLSAMRHRENHCLPLIEYLGDLVDPDSLLRVAQYVRSFNDPGFAMFGEVVDFVGQMLEGLEFMHERGVINRGIKATSVMMDASPLYPDGHHPVRINSSEDLRNDAIPLGRIDHPVRYYYADFSRATLFELCGPAYVRAVASIDGALPEVSVDDQYYDGYKADVYSLGDVFDKEFLQKFHQLDFLKPFVVSMKQRDPLLRPSASELVRRFARTRRRLNPGWSRWLLGKRFTPVYERCFEDDVAISTDGRSLIVSQ